MKPVKLVRINKEVFVANFSKLKGTIETNAGTKLFLAEAGAIVESKGRRIVIPWVNVEYAELFPEPKSFEPKPLDPDELEKRFNPVSEVDSEEEAAPAPSEFAVPVVAPIVDEKALKIARDRKAREKSRRVG